MVCTFKEDRMKNKIIFFVFIMLALMLTFSCSKNSTSPDDFPDNPLEWFSIPYVMEIEVSNSKGVEIEVLCWDSLTTGELTINGYTAPLEISGWFFYWIYSPVFDSTFTSLNPGDSISYTLAVNGKSYSGEMNITYQPDISWSQTFDITQYYTFSWNIPKEPEIYVCDFGVDYYDEEHNDKDYTWTLDSPRDEYTIKTKYYDDYDDLEFCEIMFASYNYRNFGSCFVYSSGYQYKNYFFGIKNESSHPDNRLMQLRRLQFFVKSLG